MRRDDQIEELKALGGDYVINSETTSISDKVQEITKVHIDIPTTNVVIIILIIFFP